MSKKEQEGTRSEQEVSKKEQEGTRSEQEVSKKEQEGTRSGKKELEVDHTGLLLTLPHTST